MKSALLVEDDSEFAQLAGQIIEHLGWQFYHASNMQEARSWLQAKQFEHILLDVFLPDGSGMQLLSDIDKQQQAAVTFITGHQSIKGTLSELCSSSVSYLLKPIQQADIESVLFPNQHKIKRSRAEQALNYTSLVGNSDPMKKLYQAIEQVAGTDANVLLIGESGTGKEEVAKAIHHASGRSGKLVSINCGGLTKELIASELFGHEKGAFTGAYEKRAGAFEQARDGTLFLDEVSEMPIDMQPHLLRALETNRVTPVGGHKEVPVNCRIVSATNRALTDIAEQRLMREDIYFRLAVFPIELPNLRDKPSDIPLLVEHFLAQFNQQHHRDCRFDADAMRKLESYDWPGNIRELKHFVHRAFIMTPAEEAHLVWPDIIPSPFSQPDRQASVLKPGTTIDAIEKQLIEITLNEVNGNKTAAADMLGISTKTLYNRLNAYRGDDTDNVDF